MDAYQTLDYLVDGMKTASTTNSWDVVVSYSIDKLNDILKTLWTNNHATAEIKVKTKGQNEDEEEYNVDWNLKLGSPTLSFTMDNRASLTMPLSGTRQVETESDGKTHPVLTVQEGDYVFKAIVPLAFVRAKEGDNEGKDPKSSVQTIEFDNDPKSKLHVVFQFDTTDLANYSIARVTSPKPQKIDFNDLPTKVAAWMQDPSNLSTITYSLAVVARDQTVGAVYLTPETVSFSVYSKGSTVGCLCVYIKTKDSGFEPGDVTRAFKLYNNKGEQTYPIPKDYSSSIIIRRELFQKKFLSDPLKAATDSNHTPFKSVTPETVNTGFSFDIRLDNAITKSFSNINWTGNGIHVKSVDWKFSDTKLQFGITNGQANWDFKVDHSIDWTMTTGAQPLIGTTNYHIHLSQSKSLVQVSQNDVSASVGITQSDWTRGTTIDGKEYSPVEINYVPDEIRDGLNAIAFPTFSSTMRLDFFATTNIFAPNQHIIDIDTAKGVFTPYDVMIVGQVAEKASMASPMNSNGD